MAYNPIVVGGGTEAAAQRVTIANDSTGVLSVDDNGGSLTVDASSLPLPTGASTAARQDTGNTSLASIDGKITAVNTGAVVVSSSALPSGASTAAKQPALGTAGSASSDVITVQGIASMTALKVDGSAVTQPVSGTVTANAGTNLNTSALALESGGNLATIAGAVRAEDSASADADKGIAAFAVRKATPANTSDTDGDYEALQMSAGRLWVDASGKTLTVDGSGVTQPVSGTVTANQGGTWTVQPGNTANTTAWKVDGSAVTQPVSGTVTATIAAGATTIAKAEDAASADADVGVPAMAVRKATPANTSGADGDYEMLQMSAGRLWTSSTIDAAIPAGTNLMGKVGIDQTTVGTTNAVSIAQLGANTISTGNGTSGTGVLRVAQVSDGTGLVTVNPATAANWGIYVEDAAETAGGNLSMVGTVRRDTAASSAGTTGDNATLNTDATGRLWTTETVIEDVAHSAGEAIAGIGARRIDPCASSSGSDGDWSTVNQSAEGALWAVLAPTTASGCSVFMATSADGSTALTNSAQAIKASAGNLYGYYIGNPNTSAVYVHLYNTAAASVTVGTTNPLVTFYIPASSAANLTFPYPITFTNAGWSTAATTTGGGNTAPSTALEAVFYFK